MLFELSQPLSHQLVKFNFVKSIYRVIVLIIKFILFLQQAASTAHKASSNSLPTLQAAIDRSLMAATPPSHFADLAASIPSLPASANPRYYFDIVMDGRRMGRVIIEVEAGFAPKMAANFHALVTGERGFGYRGCQFFQVCQF
jgi:hypothetical protein